LTAAFVPFLQFSVIIEITVWSNNIYSNAKGPNKININGELSATMYTCSGKHEIGKVKRTTLFAIVRIGYIPSQPLYSPAITRETTVQRYGMSPADC
jgi:hypothetical protein